MLVGTPTDTMQAESNRPRNPLEAKIVPIIKEEPLDVVDSHAMPTVFKTQNSGNEDICREKAHSLNDADHFQVPVTDAPTITGLFCGDHIRGHSLGFHNRHFHQDMFSCGSEDSTVFHTSSPTSLLLDPVGTVHVDGYPSAPESQSAFPVRGAVSELTEPETTGNSVSLGSGVKSEMGSMGLSCGIKLEPVEIEDNHDNERVCESFNTGQSVISHYDGGTEHFQETPVSLIKTQPIVHDASNNPDQNLVEASSKEKQYLCAICSKSFSRKSNLNWHLGSHRAKKAHPCDVCGKTFSCPSHLKAHELKHSGIKPFSCSTCGVRFTQQSALTKHRRMNICKNKTPYTCKFCDKEFYRKGEAVRHDCVPHQGEKPFPCTICEQKFVSRSQLKAHTAVHMVAGKYQCEICDKRCSFLYNLRKHMLLHKEVKEKHVCEACNKAFSTKSYLAFHRKTHMKSFICDICNSAYPDAYRLRRHKIRHLGLQKRPFPCEVCDRSFPDAFSLARHKRTHTGERPFPCEICKKAFNENHSLKKHMRTHTGEKPYQCNLCEMTFSSTNFLKEHSAVHTGESFTCKICHKSFTNQHSLKRHDILHTEEKPFVCTTCSRGFADSSTLKKHVVIHTNERAFTCDVCKKGFRTRYNLTRHYRTHTGEKPFCCSVCGRVFADISTLKKHELAHKDKKDRN